MLTTHDGYQANTTAHPTHSTALHWTSLPQRILGSNNSKRLIWEILIRTILLCFHQTHRYLNMSTFANLFCKLWFLATCKPAWDITRGPCNFILLSRKREEMLWGDQPEFWKLVTTNYQDCYVGASPVLGWSLASCPSSATPIEISNFGPLFYSF